MKIDILYHARVIKDIETSIQEQGNCVVELGTEESKALLKAQELIHEGDLLDKLATILDDGHAVFNKGDLDLLHRAKAALAEAGGQPLGSVDYPGKK